MVADNPKFLRREEAAEYIRTHWGMPCSRGWLARLAVDGIGPLYRLSGRFPMYSKADLDDWADGRMSEPRRATGAA